MKSLPFHMVDLMEDNNVAMMPSKVWPGSLGPVKSLGLLRSPDKAVPTPPGLPAGKGNLPRRFGHRDDFHHHGV